MIVRVFYYIKTKKEMPKLNVNESVLINNPVAEVFKTLNNYNTWTAWSPWLITDPEAKVNVAADAKSYDWEGPISGSGGMKITNEKENERIDIDLNFLKPWKSFAKVWFNFKDEGDSTRLEWGMDSKMPFFMFWMKTLMTNMIAMDYQRGLSMLKEYCEDGKVHSTLDIKGNGNFEGCDYVAFKTTTNIKGVGEAMSKDYTKLMEHVMEKHSDKVAGNPFSIYHKWDFKNGGVEYSACVPVNGDIEMLPGMIKGSYPTTKVHTIHHKGAMHHVGNAWSAQYGRKQAKTFNMNKKIDPIEEYLNSPKDTAPYELEANIHFAIK